MSALTQIVGDVSPHTFTDRHGKSHTLRYVTKGVMADWEKRQLAKAREFEAGMKPLLTREEFMERLDRLSKRYGDGEFSLTYWFVKHADAFKTGATPEVAGGFLLLASLIFQCDEAEMETLMRESSEEVNSLIALVLKESLPTVESNGEAGNGVPNA